MTSVRQSQANQTSRHVRTRHVEHIFTPDDQTNQKLFISCKQSVKWNNSCCNKMRTRLIVATINPILRRPCVHPSTFHKVLIHNFCSPKRREIIIFAHNYFRKTNTNQASHCFDFYLCIFFLSKGLDTSNQLQSILTLIV